MEMPKNEHYVPRCLLRRFADQADQVFVFDKRRMKSFRSSIKNIACERYFYDVPISSAPDAAVSKDVEHALGRVDDLFAETLERAIEKAMTGKNLDDEDVARFAYLVYMQHARTLDARMMSRELTEKLMNTMIKKFEPPDSRLRGSIVEIDIDDHFLRAEQAQFLFDEATMGKIVDGLVEHVYCLGVSTGRRRFYVSDAPVVINPRPSGFARSRAGLLSPGVEIAMPLGPKLILLAYERSHSPGIAAVERKVIQMGNENVVFYNHLQVKCSRRWLFAETEAFGLAKQMCVDEPTLRDPSSARIAVA